ncbi:hypothetical protein M434DRAFT_146062 [Hypoxylon sp. CO27-5]|nr:hypothetical protein M434DRAFT_146062 [Hypoxylon sp. CO27-5]
MKRDYARLLDRIHLPACNSFLNFSRLCLLFSSYSRTAARSTLATSRSCFPRLSLTLIPANITTYTTPAEFRYALSIASCVHSSYLSVFFVLSFIAQHT